MRMATSWHFVIRLSAKGTLTGKAAGKRAGNMGKKDDGGVPGRVRGGPPVAARKPCRATLFVTMLSTATTPFLDWAQVMSASAKPRLAGRQPSTRGGVPRVRTWLSGKSRKQARPVLPHAFRAHVIGD